MMWNSLPVRSRGSSRSQIAGLALAEGLAVCGAALLCGVSLGLLTAQLIAWTCSFLSFAPLPGPQISLLDASWQHGALLLAVALPAMLAPTFAAAGRTIVSFKAERARDARRPLWQRTYLDMLLLLPALYGYWQLRAIGLSVRQLATLLIFEQALVISLGTLVGTLIGVSVSQLFMPFLQVRTDDHPSTPPFVVQIAWDQIGLVYAAVAALLVVTVAVTLLLLRRMRIFEAVKLGEVV